jgi:integrase
LELLCDKFKDGDWIESKDQDKSGIRLIQTGNIGVTEFINKIANMKWISEDTFQRLGCFEVLPGDLLISRLPDPAGRACIVPNLGIKMVTAVDCTIVRTVNKCNKKFLVQYLSSSKYFNEVNTSLAGGTRQRISRKNLGKFLIPIPKNINEQNKIGMFLQNIDNIITLHQRKHYVEKRREFFMLDKIKKTDLFYQYYAQWITVYKEGAIRDVTMDKYRLTEKWLEKLIPQLQICEMNRINYQQLLNDYARVHERQTTMDFHHQLKAAIMDAVDEELIETDPTRKAIVKGRPPHKKKPKFLNHYELQKLLECLDLHEYVNWDWFLLLVAKTGMRFSEALALLPTDFDFLHQMLVVNKTWNYKGNGGFLPTKNKSSVRKIQLDWQTVIQFSELIKNLPKETPIFIKYEHKIYNSTVNGILARHCKELGIPIISIHGLRHTHASLLLFAGVSIASVARRLGHSSMTTTQKTYLHIIQELENKDIDLIMRSLSGLNN